MAKKTIGRFLPSNPYPAVSQGSVSRPLRVADADKLLRGLRDGLGGAADVVSVPDKPFPRRYVGRGVEGDWAAVGFTIRQAAKADE